jgi:hypothetical protein
MRGPLPKLHVRSQFRKKKLIVPIFCRSFERFNPSRAAKFKSIYNGETPLSTLNRVRDDFSDAAPYLLSQSSAHAAKVDENKSSYFDGEWRIPILELSTTHRKGTPKF